MGSEVPSNIDTVTAEWLSDGLGARVRGLRSERIAQDSGRELTFYRDVAGRAPLPTPSAYTARIAGADFVLVLEDLAGIDALEVFA